MAIRQLPIVGRPTDAPAPLRKIAIEEHFIDPTLVQPNYGDSFSGEFDQQGSSYAGFNPEFAEVVNARLHDLRDGRIEEMDAAGIDVAILSHTIGGVEGISDPVLAVSTARRVNEFLQQQHSQRRGSLVGHDRRLLDAPALHCDIEDVVGRDLHRGRGLAQSVTEKRAQFAANLPRGLDQRSDPRRIVLLEVRTTAG